MKVITRYRTKYGQEFDNEAEARRIEALTDLAIEVEARVTGIMITDEDPKALEIPVKLDEDERRMLTSREIREELKRQGLSQNALAKKAGVARSLVSMVLSGLRPLTEETETKLFAALYGEKIPF
jgi:hypothetical protein